MLSLDWLSIVIDRDRPEILDYLVERLSEAVGLEFKSGPGLHGYEFSRRAESCIIAWGGETQKNTVLVTMGGAVTSVLGWYGSAALVRALLSKFGVRVKFSRLDLALDVVGEWWQYFDSPDRVIERLKDGRIKTIVIVNNYEREDDPSGLSHENKWSVTGHTTYVGSRTSERFMRIYKKTKDTGEKVTRFEYELKGRYASVIGGMMVAGENMGSAYIFANTSHLDISDIYDLSQLFEEPSASLPRKKEKRTFQWLMVISKALVEFMELNPDLWATVLHEGRQKSPVCNTGVQIEIPEWLRDLEQQFLNEQAFGLPYHPIMALQG